MNKEYKISEDKFWDEINADFDNGGGVYKLFCKDNDEPKPVCRLLGTDTEGVLYIGKADSFLDRVIDLKKTIDQNKKSTPHIGGRRYNKNEKIRQAFPYSNLFVELIGSDKPCKKEKELLDNYFNKFGEFPPLNASDN